MTVGDCSAFFCSILFVTAGHGLCALLHLQLRTEPAAEGYSGNGCTSDRNGDAVFIKDIRKQQLFDRSCHWQGRVGKSP